MSAPALDIYQVAVSFSRIFARFSIDLRPSPLEAQVGGLMNGVFLLALCLMLVLESIHRLAEMLKYCCSEMSR